MKLSGCACAPFMTVAARPVVMCHSKCIYIYRKISDKFWSENSYFRPNRKLELYIKSLKHSLKMIFKHSNASGVLLNGTCKAILFGASKMVPFARWDKMWYLVWLLIELSPWLDREFKAAYVMSDKFLPIAQIEWSIVCSRCSSHSFIMSLFSAIAINLKFQK